MFHRILEILLGLGHGFLNQNGTPAVQFNPDWPWQKYTGAAAWNVLAVLAAIVLVYMVYSREGRARPARIVLGLMRLALLGFVLVLLNRPVLILEENRREPSVLAILIDDSLSMKVPDMPAGPDGKPTTRLQAVADLIGGHNGELVRQLARQHILKFYSFDQTARQRADVDAQGAPAGAAGGDPCAAAIQAVNFLQPIGNSTQVAGSLHAVLDQLQGQRVAGVVILTDGKDVPTENTAQAIAAIKQYNVRIYPIAVGSEKPPQNIEVQGVSVQDSAFKGDVVSVKATVRAIGYEPGHLVRMQLLNKKTGMLLLGPDGRPVELSVAFDSDQPREVELLFKAQEIGTLDFDVVAVKQPGEINDAGNVFSSQIDVLDAKINVLYVDGYPRWDYRYVKTEMIREPTLRICCLLQSADLGFRAERSDLSKDVAARELKYFPYMTSFPETIEQIQECDVVLLGDVDPEQFSDRQMQALKQFVSEKRGGFGMIAGPRWSPQAFKGTLIQDMLPVNIAKTETEDTDSGLLAVGFRPVITQDGRNTSIFRFFADRQRNDRFLRDELQMLFWYCRGVTAKTDIAEVLAEHPTDIGPDGRKAPLLVLGHYGSGRTLFSAIDDSWRWRYYTGESIFNTYWIQQIRYLAREKKLGQRKMTLLSQHPSQHVGEEVSLKLHVLDLALLSQLQDQIPVQIFRDSDGAMVRQEMLIRQQGQSDLYSGAYTADQPGRFTAHIASPAPGISEMIAAINVEAPGGELEDPRVEHKLLSELAAATDGDDRVTFDQARQKLPGLIPSAAKIMPIDHSAPLWDAPLAMAIFVLLITLEWVLRKVLGML